MSDTEADQLVLSQLNIQRVTYPMRNLGNTCFFNAVMQCLTHTQPLIKLCLSGIHTKNCKKGSDCFLCLYARYINGISQNKATSPQIVVQQLRKIWPRYHLGRQEDAHEFLMLFIDSFLNACFQTAKPARDIIWKNQEKTPVFKIFGGKLRSQVHCLGCKHNSNTYEDMSALSLDLPAGRGGFSQSSLSVEMLLNNFCRAEMLKGQNKYQCSSCKKKCEAVKRFSIEKGPRVLLIHLKRFTNFGTKIKDFIKYPKSFSLKQFTSGAVDNPNSIKKQQNSFGTVERESQIQQDNEMYDLYGVVVHQGGGCRSGHYYSYAKGLDNQWYSCNDEFVGKLQNGIDGALNQQAYILFYQKRIMLTPVSKIKQNLKEQSAPKQQETQKTIKEDHKKLLSQKSTSISSQAGSDRESPTSPNNLDTLSKKNPIEQETLNNKILSKFADKNSKLDSQQTKQQVSIIDDKIDADSSTQSTVIQKDNVSNENNIQNKKKDQITYLESIKNPIMKSLVSNLIEQRIRDEDILWPKSNKDSQKEKQGEVKESVANENKQIDNKNIQQKASQPLKNQLTEPSKNPEQSLQKLNQKSIEQNTNKQQAINKQTINKEQNNKEVSIETPRNKQSSQKSTPTSQYNIRTLRRDLHPKMLNEYTKKRQRCALEAVDTMSYVIAITDEQLKKRRKLNC